MEKEKNWYFTFGSGQAHDGCYIKFSGTHGEARQKMVDAFGLKWSMQYSEENWKNPREDSIRYNGLDPKNKPTLADVWNWKEIH